MASLTQPAPHISITMNTLKRGIRNLIVITVLLSNIGCDQISKTVARAHIKDGERIAVITDLLTLTKVENTGAFLSLGSNLPEFFRMTLLVILPMLVLGGMMAYVLTKRKIDLNYALPIAFVIGGGIGNLLDRVLYSSVTDFMHINFQLFQTGIFNMADVSIMVGAFWMLLVRSKMKMQTESQ